MDRQHKTRNKRSVAAADDASASAPVSAGGRDRGESQGRPGERAGGGEAEGRRPGRLREEHPWHR